MKSNYFLLPILLLCIVFSCSKDSVEEGPQFFDINQEKKSSSEVSQKMNCGSIIPVLITSGPNAPSGQPTIYVTAGVDVRNYSREVTVTVFNDDDSVLLSQVNLIIPANQSLSNFMPTIGCYGEENTVGEGGVSDVRLTITSVRNLSNFTFETCYVLTDMDFTIPKCPKEIDRGPWIIVKDGETIQFN